MKKRPKQTKTWIAATVAEAAAALAVSDRSITGWLSKGMPGRKGRYVLPELIEWLREHVWRPRVVSDDPLMASGDSPNLERYRAARAAQEEIKLALMNKESVPTREASEMLNLICRTIRSYSLEFQKRYGPEAQDLFDKMIDETAEAVGRWTEDHAPKSNDPEIETGKNPNEDANQET